MGFDGAGSGMMVGRLHLSSSRWLLGMRSQLGVRASGALVRRDTAAHTESGRSRRLCLDVGSGTGRGRNRSSGNVGSVALVCTVRRESSNRS
jgi:hypothetical protein